MNLALKTKQTFDVDAARLTLANAIKDHRKIAKAVEELKTAVANAERRMAELRDELPDFATVVSRVAEAASIALRDGCELVTPPELANAKQRHEEALAQMEFAEGGLARLRADLALRTKDLVVAHDRVIEAINPIAMDAGESLAAEVARLESLAAKARAKLSAFAASGVGRRPQKCGRIAYGVLHTTPENGRSVMTNTPLWILTRDAKKSIVDWRASLEADANAHLNLDDSAKPTARAG
jgi:hypothetical protein